jgi:membrane protease YdiL (CAAX protease family)
MRVNRQDLARATAFYLSAVGLSTLVSVLTVALDRPAILGFVMFTPLVAVLLTQLVFTRDGFDRRSWRSLGLHIAGWREWPLAIWLPLLVLAGSYAISTLAGVAWWRWPPGTAAFGYFANLLVSLVISTVFAAGEEIGWRGYLLPKLLGLGRVPAVLLTGFLHGVWHLPMILLTSAYHSDGNRLVVVVLFLATLSVGGAFYGYLRLASGSVWPVAVAHGAFNTIWSALAVLTVPSSALWMEYLSGESGAITLVLAVVAVLILYCNGRKTLLKEPARTDRPGVST